MDFEKNYQMWLGVNGRIKQAQDRFAAGKIKESQDSLRIAFEISVQALELFKTEKPKPTENDIWGVNG